MKPRNRPDPKAWLALVLALAAAPALANEAAFGPLPWPPGKIAQFSPEERRAMRERWEQAEPEERLRLRREFQDRMERFRQLPPAERERLRPEREGRGQRGSLDEEGRFGTGFERRGFEDGRFENPSPPPNPGDFFDRRHNRHRP